MHPGADPGRVSVVEPERTIDLIPRLTTAGQLVEALHELRKAQAMKQHERRYVESFRGAHQDFLRRYAEVRRRIVELLPDEEQ